MSTEQWPEFKIVGDNIDKNVRPTYQRLESNTQSLHYFHSFAIRDRVDLSACSDVTPKISPSIDPAALTPMTSDLATLQKDCEILVSRYALCMSMLC